MPPWWAPYLPGFFAFLAVAIAFLTAWQTGVFESRNNALRAEVALLERRKQEYLFQATARAAEVAAFVNKLTMEASVRSAAIDDLAHSIAREDERQSERVALLVSSFDAETDVTKKALLGYALFLGTRKEAWRETLCDLLLTHLDMLDETSPSTPLADIFGDSRWPDADRPAVAAALVRGIETLAGRPKRQLQLLNQIGNLHVVAYWSYGGPRPTTAFRLDRQPAVFIKAVIIARKLILEEKTPEAMAALARFSPPALVAVVATIVQRAIDRAGESGAYKGPAAIAQDSMDYAVPNVAFALRVTQPRFHEPSFEDYVIEAKWSKWLPAHAEFVALWMEPTLATLQHDFAKLYGAMFESYN